VEAEELLVDEAGERDIVEHLHGEVVGLLVVLVEACVGRSVHSVRKLKKEVSCRHSWLPRSMITCFGRANFIARINKSTSIEKLPRST
jgi:hypothetical protein